MTQNGNSYLFGGQQQNTYGSQQQMDQPYSFDPRTMSIQRPQPIINPTIADNIIPVTRMPSLDDARNFPVAPGHGVTFFIDNQPYVCTKTLGTTALDQPVFRKWRLVEESEGESNPNPPEEIQSVDYVEKEEHEKEISSLNDRIDKLEKMISEMQFKNRPVKTDNNRKDHKQQNWRNKQQ